MSTFQAVVQQLQKNNQDEAARDNAMVKSLELHGEQNRVGFNKLIEKITGELNGVKNVILLNPSKVKSGYYVETGWATTNKNIDTPNSKSIWEIQGNSKLTPNTPINLVWLNDQNIRLIKGKYDSSTVS